MTKPSFWLFFVSSWGTAGRFKAGVLRADEGGSAGGGRMNKVLQVNESLATHCIFKGVWVKHLARQGGDQYRPFRSEYSGAPGYELRFPDTNIIARRRSASTSPCLSERRFQHQHPARDGGQERQLLFELFLWGIRVFCAFLRRGGRAVECWRSGTEQVMGIRQIACHGLWIRLASESETHAHPHWTQAKRRMSWFCFLRYGEQFASLVDLNHIIVAQTAVQQQNENTAGKSQSPSL